MATTNRNGPNASQLNFSRSGLTALCVFIWLLLDHPYAIISLNVVLLLGSKFLGDPVSDVRAEDAFAEGPIEPNSTKAGFERLQLLGADLIRPTVGDATTPGDSIAFSNFDRPMKRTDSTTDSVEQLMDGNLAARSTALRIGSRGPHGRVRRMNNDKNRLGMRATRDGERLRKITRLQGP